MNLSRLKDLYVQNLDKPCQKIEVEPYSFFAVNKTKAPKPEDEKVVMVRNPGTGLMEDKNKYA